MSTNHPNRGQRGEHSSPTPPVVRLARELSGLSPTEAATVVHVNTRTWLQWEAGEKRMHPAVFELFKLKTAPQPTDDQLWELWLYRTDIRDGDLKPQLLAFARTALVTGRPV